MARRRNYKRDVKGRFAKVAGSGRKAGRAVRASADRSTVAGAVAGAAVGGALASKPARKRVVRGSVAKESYIGTTDDGKWTGVKVGGRYAVGKDRELIVKGIVGVNNRNPRDAKRRAAQMRKIAADLAK
ncbi:hypothetical protein [Rhodococcus rhodochrous]|uniref:hypothetical protein n=1 Tax=Rhodococcus rhodochrous TaxID=1829 RepID=UPI0024BBDEB4|nr:hypothetical protein [Rhodococcus rhodochrous]MDJ0401743.1 hypothetical protein [Rhodococcus rhodochrous]